MILLKREALVRHWSTKGGGGSKSSAIRTDFMCFNSRGRADVLQISLHHTPLSSRVSRLGFPLGTQCIRMMKHRAKSKVGANVVDSSGCRCH